MYSFCAMMMICQLIKKLFTDHYLGQASITSCDILIEKIGANTGFKLSFTSSSIED